MQREEDGVEQQTFQQMGRIRAGSIRSIRIDITSIRKVKVALTPALAVSLLCYHIFFSPPFSAIFSIPYSASFLLLRNGPAFSWLRPQVVGIVEDPFQQTPSGNATRQTCAAFFQVELCRRDLPTAIQFQIKNTLSSALR